MPRLTIHPTKNHITLNGTPLTIPAGAMPAGPVLDGFSADPARLILVIHFDGAIGTIEQRSRAPGRIDFVHFLGGEPLAAYVAAFEAEKAKVDAERAVRDAEAEKNALLAAEAAAKADAEKGKK